MKVILRMSHKYDGGSAQPGFGASSKQQHQTVPPSYGGGSNQPIFGASSIQQPQTSSVSYGVGSSQPKFGASVVQHGARDVPPKFLVLVQELEAIKATGSPAPRWNNLGKLVRQRLPSVVSDAGVKHWSDYLVLAEQEGIIEIMRHPNKGRNIGKSTISLRI
ncbi:hypothetical protein FRC04_005616 [Tulasnella sp. 424]|nr:hypothetical protein FRC04_005616 [Tulasnella sp. 424]